MPKHIGKYRIDRKLGEGGMGVVYQAWDTSLDRAVALKTIIPQLAANEEFKERLLREARSAAQLQHPHVVTVYEFGEIEGQLFIAMEYIRGHSLSEELLKGSSLERKVQIMAQTCQALAYAHRAGIVHRDIKPSNIYIGEDGSVKLLDFGIARVADSELTRTGLSMGTPEYMSPEMVEGGKIDQRSDIFSCGVVFYELLTTVKPFKHERLATTLYNILHLDPPPLGEAGAQIPASLQEVVSGMLEKKAADRVQSLENVVEEIEHIRAQFLIAKAAKAKQLNDLFVELEMEIRQVAGGEQSRHLLERRFKKELTKARRNVSRLSKASDTSISLEMVQTELDRLEDLRKRISNFTVEELAHRVQRAEEPTRRLEAVQATPPPAPPPAVPLPEDQPSPEKDESQPPAARSASEGRRWMFRAALASAAGLAAVILLWNVFQGWGGDSAPKKQVPVPTISEATLPQPPSREQLSLQLQAAFEEGRPQEVVSLAAQLESSGALSAKEFYYKGWALVRQKQFERAIPPLSESLKSDPANASAQLLLGQAFWRHSGQNEPALKNLLAALDQGSLTASQQRLARNMILEMEHVFESDHLHPRRLRMFGGGKCSGKLILNQSAIRFQADKGGEHSQLLVFPSIASITIEGSQMEIRQSSNEISFEFKQAEDLPRMERLLGQIHRFEAVRGESGTLFQVN